MNKITTTQLTGLAEKEFMSWYINNYGNVYFGNEIYFEGLPLSMKFSVYVEFFDTVNILPDVANLFIPHCGEFPEKYCATVQTPDKYYHLDFTDDVNEARIIVLEKACEIYESEKLKCT
jgi:hypothetical protein